MTRLTAAVSGLVLLAALVAFVGPLLSHPRAPAGVTLAGRPVGATLTSSLSDTLAVQPPDVRLRVSVLGLPWPVAPGPDVVADQFLAGPVRLVFGGSSNGVVVVRQPSPELGGVVQWSPLLLTLFAAAYAESLLRKVRRRGRARRVDALAMGGVGAITGLALVLLAWAVAGRDVGLAVLLAVLVLMSAAGYLAALLQAALRRRPAAPRAAGVPDRPAT